MAGILDGKVAIITGAASGIGRATAQIFAREGARLLLADVQEAGGAETLKLVQQAGANALFIRVDVAKSADTEAMVAKAVESFGGLDCAFNNAGIDGKGGRIHECSEENWNRVLSINLTSVWLCMKAEIAQMLKQDAAERSSTRHRWLAWRAEPGCPRISRPSTASPGSRARRRLSTAVTISASTRYVPARFAHRCWVNCFAPVRTRRRRWRGRNRSNVWASRPKSVKRWHGYVQIALRMCMGCRCRWMAATWRNSAFSCRGGHGFSSRLHRASGRRLESAAHHDFRH
jgi:NAD(P)-dependent dehydrogenase (short-subunit alcohol dehydrogenase family)